MKKFFLILLLGLSTVFMPIIDNIADAAPRHYSGQHHYKSRPGVYRPVYYADYYRPYHHGYYNYSYYVRSGLSDGEKIALGIIGVAAIAGALSD